MFQTPTNTVDIEHPVVPILCTCSGLNQTTEFHYTVDANGKRVALPELSNAKPGTMRRRMCMRLPLLFSPEVWIRHKYSLADVIETLNYFRSIHLWQLAVLLGIPLSNSSVKLAFSTPTSMVFSSKAIVLVKIANHLRKYYKFAKTCVLDKTHEDHVPPLPVHRVPMPTYQLWKQHTPSDKNRVNMLSRNSVAQVFTWNGVQMVPLWMEGDCIYMIRVVTQLMFEQSGRESDALATKPIEFMCAGMLYCGLVDEAAFFLPSY